MKKTVIFIVYMTAIVSLSTGIFLWWVEPRIFDPNASFFMGWVYAEKNIFLHIISFSQGIFPRGYLIHTIGLYGLVLVGLIVILKYFYKKIMQKKINSAGNWIRASYRKYKRRYLMTITWVMVSAFLIGALTVVMVGRELKLRTAGISPGNFYRFTNFTSRIPKMHLENLADVRGMTYCNPQVFRYGFPHETIDINNQGFPASFEYTQHVADSVAKKGKKKIMVLGDSFTYGTVSTTHDKCFTEIWRSERQDAVIYSFGIPGTDVVQYRLVAEKFMDSIKPDQVIVAFCGDNDVMSRERIPQPYIPLIQGGFMLYVDPSDSSRDGLVLSLDSAYYYYRARYSIFGKSEEGIFVKMCQKSSLLTNLFYSPPDPFEIKKDSLATYRNLVKIKNLADSAKADFEIFFIPTPETLDYSADEYQSHFGWVFGDMFPLIRFCKPKTILRTDYLTEDCHFNDSGNLKFANAMAPFLVR